MRAIIPAMPITRFLRPIAANVWDMFINCEPVARIEASEALGRIGYTVKDLQGKVLGEDTHLGTLALRVADGEFDNDFRFEYELNPEPSSNADLYFITQYATPSQKVIDSWTTEDPGAAIEAAREAQMYSLEERLDMYAARGW